jgi:enamine deaminase RidA (YjgF/YER057c/UK114 family)
MATIEKYCAPSAYDPRGYSQAVRVTGAQTILILAGQVAYDTDGVSSTAATSGARRARCSPR